MRSLAARQDFEQAQKIKEDLELLEHFSLRSYISSRGRGDCDVLAACLLGREAFFVFFAVSGGRVSKSEFFHLPTLHDSVEEVMREFLLDFYRLRPLPGEIIVSTLPTEARELADFFSAPGGPPRRHPRSPAGAKRRASWTWR